MDRLYRIFAEKDSDAWISEKLTKGYVYPKHNSSVTTLKLTQNNRND